MAHIDPDDETEYGIYGQNLLIRYDGPRDAEGIPIATPELFRRYDRYLESYERQWRACLGLPWPPADEALAPPDDSAPEAVKDAYLGLTELKHLKRRYAQFDLRAVVLHAIKLGQLIERFDVRWAERYADTGRA